MKFRNMKNSLKIALGIAAGGALVLLARKRKLSRDRNTFIAPDGKSYRENEMYRTSEGDIYKNGKLMHFETPELSAAANAKIDSNLYRKNSGKENNQSLSHNVTYHKRGVRHH